LNKKRGDKAFETNSRSCQSLGRISALTIGRVIVGVNNYASTMINEDELEQLAIQGVQNTGWNTANGADLAPESGTPERADFEAVVLMARLAPAVQPLNPKLPTAAVAEVVQS
jgi:hypothetical protein